MGTAGANLRVRTHAKVFREEITSETTRRVLSTPISETMSSTVSTLSPNTCVRSIPQMRSNRPASFGLGRRDVLPGNRLPGLLGPERSVQEPEAMQFPQPLAVLHISLASRHKTHTAGIDQIPPDKQRASFQNFHIHFASYQQSLDFRLILFFRGRSGACDADDGGEGPLAAAVAGVNLNRFAFDYGSRSFAIEE
jgi:hypothetical protein